jgi:1,4-dihydroxy-2-naphthoyl-CoA hydrolase
MNPPDAGVFRHATSLEQLNAHSPDTAMAALGIVFTGIGPDFLRATMPVDGRTRQPYGLLHGGASVLLAETLGSSAGNLCVQPGEMCVGVEINANHLVAVRDGLVTGTARPLHIGRRTQVWDPAGRLVCISRLTLAVVPQRA